MSMLEIGVVTDEITRDLAASLSYARDWGIGLFELREGSERRFPHFTPTEVSLIDAAVAAGERITAVSPGIFKQSAADEAQTATQLADTLPRTIEMAARFECPLVIVFGFEKIGDEGRSERLLAQRAFAAAAEQAAAAGMIMAIENEPGFWVDGPDETLEILGEIGHPSLKLNWDPANRVWGGDDVTRQDLEKLREHVVNVHVKDYDPRDAKAPWVAVGSGIMNWGEILRWVAAADLVGHVTLETHCAEGVENSRKSHQRIVELLADIQVGDHDEED